MVIYLQFLYRNPVSQRREAKSIPSAQVTSETRNWTGSRQHAALQQQSRTHEKRGAAAATGQSNATRYATVGCVLATGVHVGIFEVYDPAGI